MTGRWPSSDDRWPAIFDIAGIMPRFCRNATRMVHDSQLALLTIPSERAPVNLKDISTLPTADRDPKRWSGSRHVHIPSVLMDPREDFKIAPPGLRVWFELLMAVPYKARRREDHTVTLTVEALANSLWPGYYRPSRHAHALQHALLMAHNCRLPVWSPQTRHGYFAPVNILIKPDCLEPRSEMVVTVSFIFNEAAGPLIDRRALRRYGAHSACTWRLLLSLTWLWDRYLSGRKAPGMKHLPALKPLDLIELAYGYRPRFKNPNRKHRALKRSWAALTRLFEDRQVEIESSNAGMKLLPGPAWHELQETARKGGYLDINARPRPPEPFGVGV